MMCCLCSRPASCSESGVCTCHPYGALTVSPAQVLEWCTALAATASVFRYWLYGPRVP
jgi:hypothetical protein